MVKSDLKDGMVVKLRSGETCVVLDGYIIGGHTCFQKALLQEDLTHLNNRTYDIMSIDIFDIYNLVPIWERKEKPKLSEDEQVILRNLSKEYKYIARDKNGDLYIYKGKPIKEAAVWCCSWCEFSYTHLFQMVQWEDEEPTLIEDLLRGE